MMNPKIYDKVAWYICMIISTCITPSTLIHHVVSRLINFIIRRQNICIPSSIVKTLIISPWRCTGLWSAKAELKVQFLYRRAMLPRRLLSLLAVEPPRSSGAVCGAEGGASALELGLGLGLFLAVQVHVPSQSLRVGESSFAEDAVEGASAGLVATAFPRRFAAALHLLGRLTDWLGLGLGLRYAGLQMVNCTPLRENILRIISQTLGLRLTQFLL